MTTTKILTYENLRDAYLAEDRRRNNYAGIKILDEYFGGMEAKKIDTSRVKAFYAWRREAGCGDATLLRNINPLKAAFKLAVMDGKLQPNQVPNWGRLKDSEPHGTYITPEQFRVLLGHLPEDLRPLFTFLYSTGCRIGAAQRIDWSMLSGDCRVLTLPAHIIKSRRPLTLVLDGPILMPLAEQLKSKPQQGPVFCSTNYREDWNKACDAAGLRGYDAVKRVRLGDGGARIHDLRCSGAMNLLRAGVDESTVLKIGGWKTRSMLDRYNVPNLEIIGEALTKSGEFVAHKMAAVNAGDDASRRTALEAETVAGL
ncbi:MAG: tyrosine-type recombinase/integrase [Candidatus Acidiferrum sp.]|jgi:integrase